MNPILMLPAAVIAGFLIGRIAGRRVCRSIVGIVTMVEIEDSDPVWGGDEGNEEIEGPVTYV